MPGLCFMIFSERLSAAMAALADAITMIEAKN
jgi:hypothetical protein